MDSAIKGLSEFIKSLGRIDRRELKSWLVLIMQHVYKWKIQPERRSTSWVYTINNARWELIGLREGEPSLTDDVVQSFWEECQRRAYESALTEMGDRNAKRTARNHTPNLTWQEVFDDEYWIDPA